MSVSLRRRPFLLANTTAQTYEDEPPSPNGNGNGPQPLSKGPMPRRGTNDFGPNGRHPPNGGSPAGGAGAAANNLTMGQQPAPPPQPKEKVSHGGCNEGGEVADVLRQVKQFDYRYDDTDTLMNELSEFYPYVEMPDVVNRGKQILEFRFNRMWLSWLLLLSRLLAANRRVGWTSRSKAQRRQLVEEQLELMESPVRATRREAQSKILYLLQGEHRGFRVRFSLQIAI